MPRSQIIAQRQVNGRTVVLIKGAHSYALGYPVYGVRPRIQIKRFISRLRVPKSIDLIDVAKELFLSENPITADLSGIIRAMEFKAGVVNKDCHEKFHSIR